MNFFLVRTGLVKKFILHPCSFRRPPSPPPTPSLNPLPNVVLTGCPNPLLKVIKLSCVRYHTVPLNSANRASAVCSALSLYTF